MATVVEGNRTSDYVCPSFLSAVHPPICLSLRLSVFLFVFMSVCLHVSARPSICLFVRLSIGLSVCMFALPSVCFRVCLSAYNFLFRNVIYCALRPVIRVSRVDAWTEKERIQRRLHKAGGRSPFPPVQPYLEVADVVGQLLPLPFL